MIKIDVNKEKKDDEAEKRGKIASIAKCDQVWNSDASKLYKGPVVFPESSNEKIDYFSSIGKRHSEKKDKKKKIGKLKTREVEKWTIKVTQSSLSLDSLLKSGRSTGSRDDSRSIKRSEEIEYLDAVGSYYDGMNLIYILFYAYRTHALFISAYDISGKDFYQIVHLGNLYNDNNPKGKFPEEKVIYASAYTYENDQLFWYVKGSKVNVWVAEHHIRTLFGMVSHYAALTAVHCVHNSEASLASINGSMYLAGLGAPTMHTLFSTGQYQDVHGQYLLTARKHPIICSLGEDVYHIGGLVNKSDNLVEVHRVNLAKNTRNTTDYAPGQRRKLLRNTYVVSDVFAINAINSAYCQLSTDVYIFNDDLFEEEEYLKYSLLSNRWEILRYCKEVKPEFETHSRCAVAVGKQVYFFLFNSEDSELSYKILHKE